MVVFNNETVVRAENVLLCLVLCALSLCAFSRRSTVYEHFFFSSTSLVLIGIVAL